MLPLNQIQAIWGHRAWEGCTPLGAADLEGAAPSPTGGRPQVPPLQAIETRLAPFPAPAQDRNTVGPPGTPAPAPSRGAGWENYI